MPDFSKLQALLPKIEDAEVKFEMQTNETYDETRIAAATAEFNQVLEQAAMAAIAEVHDPVLAKHYLSEWRPATRMDTWFGTNPVTYVRHILRDNTLHQLGAPDMTAVH